MALPFWSDHYQPPPSDRPGGYLVSVSDRISSRRRGPQTERAARDQYIRGDITWWELEDYLDILLRGRHPTKMDLGVLHGPAPDPEKQRRADEAAARRRLEDELFPSRAGHIRTVTPNGRYVYQKMDVRFRSADDPLPRLTDPYEPCGCDDCKRWWAGKTHRDLNDAIRAILSA